MTMKAIALALLLLLAASTLAPVVPSWSNGKSTQEQPSPANNVALSDGEIVTMTVSVLEDESMMSHNPDSNSAGNQNRGGLWVGYEPIDGMTRSWLKFNLSHIPDNVAIQSATLNAYLNDEWVPESDAAIGAYYSTNDTWSTETITWNNQPDFSATPSDIIDSPASPDMFVMGDWYHWDVSGAVAETIQGDKILSEVLKQVDEGLTNETWKYFLDKDYLADYPFNDTYLALQYVTPATDGLAVDGRTTSPLIDYIQDATPTLSWHMADPDSSDYQTDYELQVSDSPYFNDTLVWESNHTNRVTVYDTGTSDNLRPWGTTQEMRFQFKWPTALLDQSGLVDRLLFEVGTPYGSVTYENLVVSMVNTIGSSALTADFIANYGGETPITVLNRQAYVAEIIGAQLIIDVENTFILNAQRSLIVEVRFTNCSSTIALGQFSTTDGGSVAYEYGPGDYTATTASLLYARTHNLMVDFATESVYCVPSSGGNWFPFGVDIGTACVFQWKYNRSLVDREGTIDRLYFGVWGGTQPVTIENLTISLVETPVEGALSLDFEANYGGVEPTVVYQAATATFHEVNGVLIIDIDDIFVYGDEHDLLIDLRFDAIISGEIALRAVEGMGGYRAYNLTWGSHAIDNSPLTYDLAVDFVDPESQVEYAGAALTNSTEYYWRVRTCDATGIWSDWTSQYFKYEKLSSAPEWEGPVNSPDPAMAGHTVTVSINVTYFLGINQVLIEYGGSNHTMTPTGNTYTYTWTPSTDGTLNYTVYMESAIGTWSSVGGSFEVQAAPFLPIDTTTLLIIVGVVVILGAVVCLVKRR